MFKVCVDVDVFDTAVFANGSNNIADVFVSSFTRAATCSGDNTIMFFRILI
jgi:hypothetical protein